LEAIKNSFQKRCPQQNGLAPLFVFFDRVSDAEFGSNSMHLRNDSSRQAQPREQKDTTRMTAEIEKITLLINLGKFHHDLTATEPWKSWFILGRSSPFIALIQLGEI
jgi:hypothetical protein